MSLSFALLRASAAPGELLLYSAFFLRRFLQRWQPYFHRAGRDRAIHNGRGQEGLKDNIARHRIARVIALATGTQWRTSPVVARIHRHCPGKEGKGLRQETKGKQDGEGRSIGNRAYAVIGNAVVNGNGDGHAKPEQGMMLGDNVSQEN